MTDGDFDDVFEQEELPGMDDLQLEVITEGYDGYTEFVYHGGGGYMQYDYEEQVEVFKERVNEFLEEHDVVSVDINSPANEKGRVRHEAHIVYRED